ncbi:hypothetical protein PMI38_00820 [Pseudomonas sp. GM84]|uniref:NEL-type E3 ubiquitin ligase domain-containing protein n=1 Tax=Pseudomonas sp. GM84 TaxID=1144340 RepID=UPI00026FC6DA|nr:NEL-type E3 ubiquitin ligase domain-containing protein [Pseudomonas sp. GM84]EJN39701.1 hypothetical protein PMI38_00820 [Pseudomonas sp. GM84]
MTHTPYHHAQMVRSLPDWSKALHPDHASRIVQSLRMDYLDAEGVAYPWYSKADTLTREALQRAIAKRDDSRRALQTALSALRGITEFCAPLLQQRLKLDVAVDEAQYVYQAIQVKQPDGSPGGPPVSSELHEIIPKGDPQPRSLLEAALHNFEGPADTTRLSRLQRSRQDILSIDGLTVASFIEQCRTLDLGQRYQEHLDQIYDGEGKRQLDALATQARRDEFRVQVRIAACKGLLSAAESFALHGLCADDASSEPVYQGRPLRCWQLSLLGVPIHEMLFIAPVENAEHDPVFLYNPVDDDPLRGFATLGDAFQHLRTQLLDTPYRKRFVALALQAQQAGLNSRLMRELFSNATEAGKQPLIPRDSIHLEVEEKALPVHPWASLEASHRIRLRSDARGIAVPTADVDAKVRLRNLEHWLDLGMTVLNVAAMFVPCLNPIMLTLGAAQIMGSVFEGISAWEEGDNAQALAQLESVLLNVVVVGALGAGGAVLKASGFVDGMQSIIKDGKDYLWSGALDDYASEVSLAEHVEPDAQGRYSLEGRHYVKIDGQLYEQVQEDGRWRIAHPQNAQAYRPRLQDNGEGAWYATHENPLQWDDRQLLRRLGPVSEGLEGEDLDAALQSSGTSGEVLRRSQVEGQRPPALLADMLQRLRCTRQVYDIIARVREDKSLAAHMNFALPSVTELDGWPADHVIKAYSGPESWGQSVRYGTTDTPHPVEIEINRAELQNGELCSRIIAQLDEQALAELLPESATDPAKALSGKLATHLEINRATIFERLYSRHVTDLPPHSQVLASQFPGLPRRAIEEILAHTNTLERQRLGLGRVPLRVAEEARRLQAQSRLNQALLGLYRPELANADSAVLDAALMAQHPDATALQRFEIAVADRPHAARLIGQQPIRPGYQSPMRLADGRLGYPLSGRQPRGNPAPQQLQALYPSLSDRERQALLQRLRQRGDVAQQIRALEYQRDVLGESLREWENQGTMGQQTWRYMARYVINRAWRGEDMLSLVMMDIGELPSLPASFDHITTVYIQALDISQFPHDWFQSFPSLRRLRLVRCPQLDFDSLFQALEFTPRLEVLELDHNQLTGLTGAMRQRLSRLSSLCTLDLRLNDLQLGADDLQLLTQLPLERLDLEYNQIALDADMAGRFAQMGNLRNLSLNNNPLQHAPDLTGLIQLANLQLRSCGLQTWPPGLTALMSRADLQLRVLDLSGNPISQIADLDQVLASPFVAAVREGHSGRYWEFYDNGLDAQSLRRLRANGVEIDVHDGLGDATDNIWLQDASEGQRQLWDEMFEGGDNQHLRDVIERVSNSAQALSNPRGMARQVWRLLEQVGGDEALRTHLDTIAQDYPPTCGDAGADAFSDLELELETYRVLGEEPDRPTYLFQFFRKLYRREMVNALGERIQLARLARQARLLELDRRPPEAQPADLSVPELDPLDSLDDDALLQGGTDMIEIRLALRQALASDLNFPENSQDMLYHAEAMISVEVENNVEQAVRELDQTAAERRGWISRRPSWQRYLTQRYASRFTALDEYWYRGTQYLDYCLDPENDAVTALDDKVLRAFSDVLSEAPMDETGQLRRVELDSQTYDQANRRLGAGRDQARQALFDQLTAELDLNI